MKCTSPLMHPHNGEGPCPWCAEAAGVSDLTPWRPPANACPYCDSPDVRRNELADPPYVWCGACGKRRGSRTEEDDMAKSMPKKSAPKKQPKKGAAPKRRPGY